ncbi:hypothetical protein OAT16_00995 [Prolixibacteraceae bacterium]|nr:hypothetical protein [Prolixibacteraceae bacterium]
MHGIRMICPWFNHRFDIIDGQTMERAWTYHGQSTWETPIKPLSNPYQGSMKPSSKQG